MKNLLLLLIVFFSLHFNSLSQVNILNGDFEDVINGQVKSWSTSSWLTAGTTFSWEIGKGRNNSNCISISVDPNTPNDTRFLQEIDSLVPNAWYRIKGWIKGYNIITQTNKGANLCIYGTWTSSLSLTGTFGWTEAIVDFKSDISGKAIIGCRLGHWGATATGKVWFDDISIQKRKMIESKYFSFLLEESDLTVITDSNMERWLNHLDSSYVAYHDLVGHYPYNGVKIMIQSVLNNPGGWAVAGNPIKWHQPAVKNQLKSVNDDNDWSFGIMHEISHDFDDNGWAFDHEFFANLKMYYVLEVLNGKVRLGWTYYYGSGIDAFYKIRYILEKTQYKDYGNLDEYNDAMLHRFIEIQKEIGWAPFKQAFRYLYSLTDSQIPGNPVDKYFLFIKKLSDYSQRNVYKLFPQDDMNEFVAYLGGGPVNQIPEVIFGNDTIVSLNDTLFLDPKYTDDGYPYPILEFKWIKLNDPANVIINDSTISNPSIIFNKSGIYTLVLEVSDSQSYDSDTIKIIVNEQPMVKAGNDTIVSINDTLFLNAVCTDDGYPSDTLEFYWIELNNSAGLSIHTSNSLNPHVTFSKSGIYYLVLIVSDKHLQVSDTIKIIANEKPEIYIWNDTIVSVDDTLFLNPSCVDDGYPYNYLKYQWTKLNNSDGLSVSDSIVSNPYLTFNRSGEFRLAFVVTDGFEQDSVIINITANQRPKVNAGNDTIVMFNELINLFAIISDDNLPFNSLEITWKALNNPERIFINDASSPNPQIFAQDTGVYLLELTVSDGHLNNSDTIKITAQAPPTNSIFLKDEISHLAVYPNPVSGNSRVSFYLNEHSSINLQLYDIKGGRIGNSYKGYYHKGSYFIYMNEINPGFQIKPGIYFLVLSSDNYCYSEKVMVLK